MPFCPPPRHWLTKTRIPAWLRFGKIAIVSVLAMLAVAGGMLLPQAPAAEAQGSHNGYTYTQRVCQEIGQQPRHYQVRDPIPGSDWRNDGGWAIVLMYGTNTAPPEYSITDVRRSGGAGSAAGAFSLIEARRTSATNNNELPKWHLIKATNGVWGFVVGWNYIVVIDRNQDGQATIADTFYEDGFWRYGRGNWRLDRAAYDYGASYVRWANMQWCR